MCGRKPEPAHAPEEWQLRFLLDLLPPDDLWPGNYNNAPTQDSPVVWRDPEGRRELTLMEWGIVPRWTKPGEKPKMRPFNARSEGLLDSKMFAPLVRARRCIAPADGYYEWRTVGKAKQPYYISAPDIPILGMAALYQERTAADGETVRDYTIITTTPAEPIADIHNRMPVILTSEAEAAWLDPDVTDPGEIMAMLQPYPGELQFWRVGSAVGNVRNHGPELIKAVGPVNEL